MQRVRWHTLLLLPSAWLRRITLPAAACPPGQRLPTQPALCAAGLALLGGAERGGYRCIVLDPPWENASAKRSARYPTLPSRNLLGLPLRRLMCQVCGREGRAGLHIA